MMRKYLAAVLAILLVLVPVACTETPEVSDTDVTPTTTTTTAPTPETPDPIELYERADELYEQQENIKETALATVSMDVNGTKMEYTVEGSIIRRKVAGKLEYASIAETNLFGKEYVSETYYKDGVLYTHTNGEYNAEEMTEEAALAKIRGEDDQEIKKEDLSNVSLTEKDGKYIIKADIIGESAKVFDAIFASIEATATIDKVPTEMVIRADGTIEETMLSVTCNGVIAGQETVMTVSMTMKYSAPSDTITITWPDLNFYVEGYSVTDRRLAIVDKVREKLYDENGDLVPNVGALYSMLCTMYSEFDVNWALNYIDLGGEYVSREQYVVVYMTRFTLWDADGNPVENIEELYEELCEEYGQSAVDAAINHILGEG